MDHKCTICMKVPMMHADEVCASCDLEEHKRNIQKLSRSMERSNQRLLGQMHGEVERVSDGFISLPTIDTRSMPIEPMLATSLAGMQKDLAGARDRIVSLTMDDYFGNGWSLSELLASGELRVRRLQNFTQYTDSKGAVVLNLTDPTMEWDGRQFLLSQQYGTIKVNKND